MRYGYACISMQLSYPQKWGNQPKGVKPITTGRSMIRRTFDSKGHDYASELTLANCRDLDTICLLYTSPSPRDATLSRMPSSA